MTLNIFVPLSLFIITIISRFFLTSNYFFHSDSINFALAIEKYDIAAHQPHPPGYFLYVMLGRLLNLFVADTNKGFVLISILFSGLTIVGVYYLARELYDNKTALLAASLGITSPNLWFHGEVALTYTVEAFFSTLIAFFCWKAWQGEERYMWMTAIALGIAGGIRQNTPVFLLPLWLFSMKGLHRRELFGCLTLFVLASLAWFVPMVWMTGGWEAYISAFTELWLFNTGHNSVFEKGWPAFRLFSLTLFGFVVYGIGSGIVALALDAYSIVRRRKIATIVRRKVLFFSIWVLPALLFYLLIFIHPANPGYTLIFLPALLIMSAAAAGDLVAELEKTIGRGLRIAVPVGLLSINVLIFFCSPWPISYREIKGHDRYLAAMIDCLRNLDPQNTAIFLRPYVYYGTRHFMYYLPEFRVYEVDLTIAATGEIRKIFSGTGRRTFLSDEIVLPENITNFATPLKEDEKEKAKYIVGLKISKPFPSDYPFPYLATGSVRLLKEVFPDLRLREVYYKKWRRS